MTPLRKWKALPTDAMLRRYLVVFFLIGISATSLCADTVTAASLLSPRTPFGKTNPQDAVPAPIAKVKVGMKRKDVVKMLLQAPGPIQSAVETYSERVFTTAVERYQVLIDVVFQPASMTDVQFAQMLPQANARRARGEWPVPGPDDIVRAVSPPYFGPDYYVFALEVSELPKSIRRSLQNLKVGMTRKELERSCVQAVAQCPLPTEPYDLRNVRVSRYCDVRVDFDFRPSAMDEKTYADRKLREQWYRDHSWWPGENPDDIVMAIHRPREESMGGEPLVSFDQLKESDRTLLKRLQLGLTRKQVAGIFQHCGGLYAPMCPAYSLPHETDPRPFHDERLFITVDIKFERAAGAAQNQKPKSPEDLRAPSEEETDVVVGFSRPYASSKALAID